MAGGQEKNLNWILAVLVDKSMLHGVLNNTQWSTFYQTGSYYCAFSDVPIQLDDEHVRIADRGSNVQVIVFTPLSIAHVDFE